MRLVDVVEAGQGAGTATIALLRLLRHTAPVHSMKLMKCNDEVHVHQPKQNIYIDSCRNMLLTYRHEILTYDVEAHIILNFSLYKHRH
jgi:hypothetical protein